MTETREMSRLYMKAADDVARIIADHNLKSLQMSGASALSSFEYMARLAGSKTGIEAIKSFRCALSKSTGRTARLHGRSRRPRPEEAKYVAGPFRTREGRSKLRRPLTRHMQSLGGQYDRSISSNHHRAARLCAS